MRGDGDRHRCRAQEDEIDQALCEREYVMELVTVALHPGNSPFVSRMLSREADNARKRACDSPELLRRRDE